MHGLKGEGAGMIPYALAEGFLKPEHLALRDRVAELVNKSAGKTCHEVCAEVAAAVPGLRHVRGRFNYFDHSWLEIEGTRAIIDAYPWACGSGPILLDAQTGSPWASLYQKREEFR